MHDTERSPETASSTPDPVGRPAVGRCRVRRAFATPGSVGLPALGHVVLMQDEAVLIGLAIAGAIACTILLTRRAARRATEAEFQSLAQSIPGAMFRCRNDETWTPMYLGDGIEELSGYPASDFVSTRRRTIASLVHPGDVEGVRRIINAAVRERVSYTVEYRMLRSDGAIRWIREKGRGAYGLRGRLRHVSGALLDITDHRRSMAELRYQRDVQTLVAEVAAGYMRDRDLDGTITRSLERIGSFFGLDRGYVYLFSDDRRFVSNTHEWCVPGVRALVHEMQDLSMDRFPWISRRFLEGRIIRIPDVHALPPEAEPEKRLFLSQEIRSLICLPLAGDDGPIGFMGFDAVRTSQAWPEEHTDLLNVVAEIFALAILRTQSEAALEIVRREAEAASAAKSEFLASVSHEIRTPMAAIMGYAEVLKDDSEGAEPGSQRLQAVDTIQRAGSHLLTVVSDILDLSKIEASRLAVEQIDTDLGAVLRDVDGMIRPHTEARGVELRTRLHTPVPARIISDPTRLTQILTNLLANAARFTDDGHVELGVRVVATTGGERLRFEIEDTGRGMTPDQAAGLFQPFMQADATIARRHGGTGLGLTISRKLAELMGGSVYLDETAPGRGSRFVAELPLVVPANADRIDDVAAAPVPAPSGPLNARILLAEDGEDNQRLISFHLRGAGAEVDVAPDGRAALARFDAAMGEARPYDLVLTDMHMPHMDGAALARAIRTRAGAPPIVALTASATAEDRRACMDAGCADYLIKPIRKDALIATCRRWIARRREAA